MDVMLGHSARIELESHHDETQPEVDFESNGIPRNANPISEEFILLLNTKNDEISV